MKTNTFDQKYTPHIATFDISSFHDYNESFLQFLQQAKDLGLVPNRYRRAEFELKRALETSGAAGKAEAPSVNLDTVSTLDVNGGQS